MLGFDRPKGFVTPEEALEKLHHMADGVLSSNDKTRLDTYEAMATNHPAKEVLVARQKVFVFVRSRISVRDLLDEITTLDDE